MIPGKGSQEEEEKAVGEKRKKEERERKLDGKEGRRKTELETVERRRSRRT